MLLSHRRDPRARRGVTGIQNASEDRRLSQCWQSVTTFPPLQKKPDLEKYTKQQFCSLWQGHCMNSGMETQLLQKSQVSLFCVAGIWHGRQARVCPPRSTHHVKGFGGVSSRRETAASEHSFRAHPQIFLVTNSQLTP